MSELYALENQRNTALELMERRDVALRLSNNVDFKKLILDEFCVKECSRYAQASADPALDDKARADSLALAQAAGHLKRFLSIVVQLGYQAERSMPELEEALVEARQEGE